MTDTSPEALKASIDAVMKDRAHIMAERDAFVSKLYTRIAALEADAKAARDAASRSFASTEAMAKALRIMKIDPEKVLQEMEKGNE